jgi:hypothetical protein
LGLRKTIQDGGSSRNMSRGTEVEKIEKTIPKEYKWEGHGAKREKKKGRDAKEIITGLKLRIKEKRQEKGEEEGCMEINVHTGNKSWEIMTIYSKETKTTRD